jgi:hypothetical protein
LPLSLACQFKNLRRGDHICSFPRSPDEEMEILAAWVEAGLRRKEGVVCVTVKREQRALEAELVAHGVPVEEALAQRRLGLVGKWEWRPAGRFDMDAMAIQVKRLVREALVPGVDGLMVAVDMTWTLFPDLDTDAVAEWEFRWNTLIRDLPIALLCQYNRPFFDEHFLCAEVATHPMVLHDGRILMNRTFSHRHRRKVAGPLSSQLASLTPLAPVTVGS